MARQPRTVFLERRNYRRRRMTDGLRLVVIIGVILWMIPMIWPIDATADVEFIPMSQALFYVFGVWIGLIALSALLAFGLKGSRSTSADTGSREGTGE